MIEKIQMTALICLWLFWFLMVINAKTKKFWIQAAIFLPLVLSALVAAITTLLINLQVTI